MNKLEYLIAKIRNVFWCSIRKIIGHRKFKRNKYYNKKIEDYEKSNKYIYDAIMSEKPFLAARFGDAELRTLVYYLENKLKLRKGFPKYIQKVMHLNAGFYPVTEGNLMKFGDVLFNAAKNVDLYGVWFNLMEDYIIHKQAPNSKLVNLEALEPYRFEKPWSNALKGKKVLVVHPFSETIKKQYSIHDKLFENKNVLPDFELITYKAVQTNAGGVSKYDDWFKALDSMYDDISKLDFDVAIVGCGAYGLPLASKIKEMGKPVIHLAGATQILFGIRGARWDARPEMQKYFNEFWTRPSENEKPQNANSVEGGCYW